MEPRKKKTAQRENEFGVGGGGLRDEIIKSINLWKTYFHSAIHTCLYITRKELSLLI